MNDKDASTDLGQKENRNPIDGPSCDWRTSAPVAVADNASRVCRFRPDYTWSGVARESYKTETAGWQAIARNLLIGAKGESAGFDLRYFEIAPGGHSSLEKHLHEHGVIVIRGRGQALLDGYLVEVGFLDTLYISPNDPHQLLNPFAEPFGFFCIVNHERDRPRPLDPDEIRRLSAATAGRIHP